MRGRDIARCSIELICMHYNNGITGRGTLKNLENIAINISNEFPS